MKTTFKFLALAMMAICFMQCKKETMKSMQVELTSEKVSISCGGQEKINFSITDASGDVDVVFKGLPTEIQADATLNGNTGYIEFVSNLNEDRTIEATVIFRSDKANVQKVVTIENCRVPVRAPLTPEVTLESNVVYPAEYGIQTVVPFTITCDEDIDEVMVTTGKGLNAVLQTAADKKSGSVVIVATQELGEKADVTLKARNSSGESQCVFTLEKAYLELTQDRFFAEAGGDSGKSLSTITNLKVTFKIEDEDGVLSYTNILDRSVDFSISKNTTLEPRYAAIHIIEPQGKLNRTVYVSQSAIEGSTEKDIEALKALYEGLNMKDWIENGGGGIYYSNWCTDAPLDKWYGINILENINRVYYINITGYQPNATGIIPEEIGNLTRLWEFGITVCPEITYLPNSIKNLTNLESFGIRGIIDMDLADWTGLTELMNNPVHKLWSIGFCDTKLHGTIPEWLSVLPYDGQFGITGCHFSGQVPDDVASAGFWSKHYMYSAEELEACSRFDKTKYTLSEDGWYYSVAQGEAIMYLQADNYALWVGERPENTKWVDDKFGGHWEWTD